MKKVIFVGTMALMITSCNPGVKKDETALGKAAAMQALYQQNLATLKTFVADFEKEDIEGEAAQIADSAVWNSPAYGDTVHTKKHWLESHKYYMDNWSNLHLTNGQFLPGIDSVTHEFDGSVRYYGRWDGTHSSGIVTQVNFYGTYEFNADHKIISGSDYFDLGGLMNAIRPTGK